MRVLALQQAPRVLRLSSWTRCQGARATPSPHDRGLQPTQWAWPRSRAAASDTGAGATPSGGSSQYAPPVGFASLERIIGDSLGGGGPPGGDWKSVEESWVLYPPDAYGAPRAVVHFIGGGFVGAAPQLAYRPLLEALAARGALVIATPFSTSFDHLRESDGAYFRLQRALKALGPAAQALPTYGVGHSLGALLHLLIDSRYVVQRAGNILMSFNNKPATETVPLLSEVLAPSARALGPVLRQLATSPLRSGMEQWVDLLKGMSPSVVQQAIPALEQLAPIYLDLSQGTQEFTPPPEESRSIVRQGYAVPRNLLLRFADDTIDETAALASTLQSSAVASMLELTVKTLPGDHARPLTQDLNRISPDLARAASQVAAQGSGLLGRVGELAQQASLPETAKEQIASFARVASGVASMFGEAVASTDAAENIEALADEIASWMGLQQPKQVAALPPPPPARES